MTMDEAAAQLNGSQYLKEGSKALFQAMASSRLVAVFGGSDDIVYFAGASDEELGARNGSVYHVGPEGLMTNPCVDGCPYHAKLLEGAVTITAVWYRDGISWQYETAIPHVTFDVMEDDDLYCRGIVFSLDRLV